MRPRTLPRGSRQLGPGGFAVAGAEPDCPALFSYRAGSENRSAYPSRRRRRAASDASPARPVDIKASVAGSGTGAPTEISVIQTSPFPCWIPPFRIRLYSPSYREPPPPPPPPYLPAYAP